MPPTSNAEVLARFEDFRSELKEELDGLKSDLKCQIGDVMTLIREQDERRQNFRQEYDKQNGEASKERALLNHRITAIEQREITRAVEIEDLKKVAEQQGRSIEKLKTISNILVGVFSTVGTFLLLWLIGQWLNLI